MGREEFVKGEKELIWMGMVLRKDSVKGASSLQKGCCGKGAPLVGGGCTFTPWFPSCLY